MPTLAKIGDIIRALPASAARPRVAVICLQYGSQVAAEQLHEAGVPVVLWLSGVDMLGDDKCATLFCEVVLPAVQRFQQTGSGSSRPVPESADDVAKFVR